MSNRKLLCYPALVLLLCLPLSLTRCASFSEAPAPAPTNLTACTAIAVPPIPGATRTPLTLDQMITALADQRSAALAKDRCAKAWAAFYADLAK